MKSHIAILETINEARAALHQSERIDAGRNASGEGDIGEAGLLLSEASDALAHDDLDAAQRAVSEAVARLGASPQVPLAEKPELVRTAIRQLCSIAWQ